MRDAVTGMVVAAVIVVGCGGTDSAGTTETPGPDPASSVVQVIGDVCRRDAQGSGVLIAPNLILTTAHTVAGSEGDLAVRRPGAQAVGATLVGFDPERDLAVLTADGVDGAVAVFATPSASSAGVIGTVNVDGNLELLEYTTDRLIVANSGDIYDEGEVVRAAMQLRASTLPGDSGGAVFDSANHVIGIVFAQSRGDAPVAYAVTTKEVEAFLAGVDTSTEVPAGRCR